MHSVDSSNLIVTSTALFFTLLIGILLSGIVYEPSISLTITIAVIPTLIFFYLKPELPCVLLILSTMLTEFYWMEVMQGYVKPFHILSVLFFFVYTIFNLRFLKHSMIFKLFVLFMLISLASIGFSGDWQESLRSFILPLILFSIAVNVGIALHRKKISEEMFMKIVMYGSLIAVVFGLVQMVAYAFGGTLITLTDVQPDQIIRAKRPPSFFTEADNFGKFLCFPFLFLLPFAFDKANKYHKKIKLAVILILIGIIVNMTRTALIGVGFTSFLYMVYLLKSNNIGRKIGIIYGIVAFLMILMPVVLMITGALGSKNELTSRYQTLINPRSAMVEDASIAHRKRGFEETLEASVKNVKSFFIGHGWGSSIVKFGGELKSVGGNMFLNILYFSGVTALTVFILISSKIVQISHKMSKEKGHGSRHCFAEGVLFSFIGIIVISQFASMWIAPEFWLVIGCAIYLELQNKADKTKLDNVRYI